MTKTLALLHDSYRELNSKRLFWIVLAMSAVVVIIFGALGIEQGTVTLFGWHTPFHDPMLTFVSLGTFYKKKFVDWGIGVWLSWLAIILALVSTAGIFPDFLAGGSIDLYLSKPISRLRLFATKFAGGLLFVALQVTIFCVCGFILLGIRAKMWEPGLFIAIPLVVLMFSYLFAICTLLGVLTRSTIAALLLTLLSWVIISAAQQAEVLLLLGQTINEQQAGRLDRQIAATQRQLEIEEAKLPSSRPSTSPSLQEAGERPTQSGGWGGMMARLFTGSGTSKTELQARLTDLREQRMHFHDGRFVIAHSIAFDIAAPLPKTAGTIEILDRQLNKLTDFPPVATDDETNVDVGPPDKLADRRSGTERQRSRRPGQAETRQLDMIRRSQSVGWILGTSCAFEAIVLGIAAFIFCRRDY